MATIEAPAWHSLSCLEAARALHVDASAGLTSEDATRRLAEVGPNASTTSPARPRWRALLREYGEPAQLILLAAAAASLALGEIGTCLIVLGLTLLNASLALWQDGPPPAPVAVPAERELARVRRDGCVTRLPAAELVPGDVVLVAAGDAVPADGRLLESAGLQVAEGALTGARRAVAKDIDLIEDRAAPLGERTDMLYVGTTVVRGTGELVVTATGMDTEAGRIVRALDDARAPARPRPDGRLLAAAAGALMLSVAFGVAAGASARTMGWAAVAFGLGAWPVARPTAATAILAHGARALARAEVVVRRPRVEEVLGATSAIVADAGATLLHYEESLVELALPGITRSYVWRAEPAESEIRSAGGGGELLDALLLPLALNPGDREPAAVAAKGGLDVEATRAAYPAIAELPFDPSHGLSATFHRMTGDDGSPVIRCYATGAPEELVARATMLLGAAPRRADEDVRRRYLQIGERLAARGMRVVATARRDLRPAAFDPEGALLPLVERLTLLGLVGLSDSPRSDARAAVAEARAYGIEVYAISGEPAAAREHALDIPILSRATPEQELGLVQTLRERGHVVAVTGDDLNDAPALRAADVSIAMGDTAVARETAGIAIRDGGLPAVLRAVAIARGLRTGLAASARLQVTASAGLVLSFLGANLLQIAGGMPLEPLQVLYLSFTVQLAMAIGLGCGRVVAAPRSRAAIAVAATVQAAMTLAVLALVEHAHGTATARTAGLVTLGLIMICSAFILRDERRLRLATLDRPFVAAAGASLAAVALGADSADMHTTGLGLGLWLLCAGAALATVVAAALTRRIAP